MPSKSPEQHRLMEAAAHTPGGYDGVPQEVGKEFVAHDDNEQLNELDIARLIQSGELPSPQHVNNMCCSSLGLPALEQHIGLS